MLCKQTRSSIAEKQTPRGITLGRCSDRSLTMSYFHTGTCTIIGADAFHCPVRDGKEWYHVAMVIRHNGLSGQFAAWQAHYPDEFIES